MLVLGWPDSDLKWGTETVISIFSAKRRKLTLLGFLALWPPDWGLLVCTTACSPWKTDSHKNMLVLGGWPDSVSKIRSETVIYLHFRLKGEKLTLVFWLSDQFDWGLLVCTMFSVKTVQIKYKLVLVMTRFWLQDEVPKPLLFLSFRLKGENWHLVWFLWVSLTTWLRTSSLYQCFVETGFSTKYKLVLWWPDCLKNKVRKPLLLFHFRLKEKTDICLAFDQFWLRTLVCTSVFSVKTDSQQKYKVLVMTTDSDSNWGTETVISIFSVKRRENWHSVWFSGSLTTRIEDF
jgi:hypothetical protein